MISFAAILIGFLILANPVIRSFDIIPDFIGFFLIAFALSKASDLTGRLSKARNNFIILGFVEACRILALVAEVMYGDSTTPLVFATVFGVVELIFFIPGVVELFDGITDVVNGHTEYALFKERKDERRYNSTKRLTIVFYIVRIIATILPELTELELYENYGIVNPNNRSLASFKPMLYIAVNAVVVVLSVIFAIKIIRTFGRLARDKDLRKILEDRYSTEIMPRETFITAKRCRTAVIFVFLSVLASVPLIFDNVNMMCGAVSAALLIVACAMLRKYDGRFTVVIILAVIFGAVGIASTVLQFVFHGGYSVISITTNPEVMKRYAVVCAVNAAEKAVACAAFVLFFILFRNMVNGHIRRFNLRYENVAGIRTEERNREQTVMVSRFIAASIIACIIKYGTDIAFRFILPTVQSAALISAAVFIVYAFIVILTLYRTDDRIYSSEIKIA